MPDTPDPRWATISGGITRPDHAPPGTQQITLEITGLDHVIYRSYTISDEARARSYVDPLGLVLDEMVQQIDEALHA